VANRDELVEDYLKALAVELQTLGEPREVDTLFFGGGTPTHLNHEQFERLVELACRWFPLSPGYEFSVESNPHCPAIDHLPELGVTRLSLGGQSFDEQKLRTLERDHTPDQLRQCLESARAFPSGGLDLIFGVPGETLQTWQHDLTSAIASGIPHISTYGLTFEQGTTFWNRREKGTLQSLDEETERAMYALAIDLLTAAGYEHYEVSNFARPGHRCRHNEVYWAGESYFAAGPGAARYVNGRREMNHRSVTTWLKRVLAGQSPIAESEELGPEDRARELLVFGLRRMEGVRRADFRSRTGFDLDMLAGKPLRKFIDLGLLDDDGQNVRLTSAGLFVSDSIWPHFLK
jgi:oxygen-independent coproporphyrinogen-3 oxidase